jgi:hypothetical protein
MVASAKDLPIPHYDALTASEIIGRLPGLSQIDLAKLGAYGRRHQKRSTVLASISGLEAREPWAGYDELMASEIQAVLGDAGEQLAKRSYEYERAHKNRSSVCEAAARERTPA